MRSFGSDNHSGVHPKLLQSLADANLDHAPSYGTDEYCDKSFLEFEKIFGKKCQVSYVFNGTAANVIAMRAVLKPWESCLVGDTSHLWQDECGAPEFMSGGKLIPIKTHLGKLQIEDLKAFLVRRGDQHFSQVRALSITQPTELGTCYSISEIRALSNWAHENELYFHVDGARLSNAVVSMSSTFQEMITDSNVDVLSFGGTKNGLMFGEAVVTFDKKWAEPIKYIRKQSCQLPSKSRFIAAQFLTYFSSGLWKEIASHSINKAQLLKNHLNKLDPSLHPIFPVESNALFVKIPQSIVKKLREHYFFYVWDEKEFVCRLMTTWDTKTNEIEEFASILKGLFSERNNQ